MRIDQRDTCVRKPVSEEKKTDSPFRERIKVHLNLKKNPNIFSEYSFHKQFYL